MAGCRSRSTNRWRPLAGSEPALRRLWIARNAVGESVGKVHKNNEEGCAKVTTYNEFANGGDVIIKLMESSGIFFIYSNASPRYVAP